MGHATHFLKRLDRIDHTQTELALALYRDDELLKTVLSSIELPDDHERLAVSLGDPVLGPFVVLTRTGRFVTCLGHGMRASDLPVITRERFEIAAQRVQRMRDELARLQQLSESGGESQLSQLLRTLEHVGPRFCREDAEVLARVQPLIKGGLTPLMIDYLTTLWKLLPLTASMRLGKPRPLEKEGMLMCGRLYWSVAHLLPFLALSENRQFVAQVLGDRRGEGELFSPFQAFELGGLTHAHRALWNVARASHHSLRHVRHMSKTDGRIGGRLFRELSLGAVACASRKRRAEASKAIFDELPSWEPAQAAELPPEHWVDAVAGSVGAIIAHDVIDAPEIAMAIQLEAGRELVRRRHLQLGKRPYEADEQARALPEDVVRSYVATQPGSWHGAALANATITTINSLPWLSRVPLEQLYLPRTHANELLPALDLDEVRGWLIPLSRHLGFARPSPRIRTAMKIGANEPCPCESGKKAKRCCRAPGSRVAARAVERASR